jgi:nicotinate-nucleotide pyrophosphorylase (carboxylating)
MTSWEIGSARDALVAAGLDPEDVARTVRLALEEDLRYGPDITTAAVAAPGVRAVADVVARKPGVVAGLPVAAAVLDAVGVTGDCSTRDGVMGDGVMGDGVMGDGWMAVRKDGELVSAGDVLATIRAPLRELLGAERTLLNFLTHLSGIATATRAWVDAVEGTGASVRDTRKTIPGLRALEKYAVRCGGGRNHRMGLGDAALIKDNHVAAAGGVVAAFQAVRDAAPDVTIEVECDTLDQVWDALRAGVTLILLDNMGVPEMSAAVRLAREYPLAKLEASGGLRLENAREVAETGVHYLSVGALTHSSPALDIALDIVQ